jgi:hypothetical protein
MQRLAMDESRKAPWITVQADRYRYLASTAQGTVVRIVIREYLACEVLWVP